MKDRWPLVALFVVCAFQAWAANRYTVFDDEAFSCRRYVLPMGEMVSGLWHGVEPDPPLYYVLQNLWVRCFGVGPLGLRGLSIILFLNGLVFMQAAGEAWFGPRVGQITFLLCALHPAHLFFGFAARWYALMFLLVAMLLWITGRITCTKTGGASRGWFVAWAIAAAASCYTNYFGPVVVGLVWLAAAWTSPLRRTWVAAGIAAAALYAPWLPAFWQQATTFPDYAAPGMSFISTAGRTLTALVAGNLAAPSAWWVWAPSAIFGVILVVLVVRQRKSVGPLVLIVPGCFAAGILTRTMIDKYVMTFSGPACLLVAAALSDHAPNRPRRLARIGAAALGAAWIGCGVNLLTESHWSSLRWLDPFGRVVREWIDAPGAPNVSDWVVAHPAGRYYIGCEFAIDWDRPWRIDPQKWRDWAEPPSDQSATSYRPMAPEVPASMLQRLSLDRPDRVLTIRTAGYADDPAWDELWTMLNQYYNPVEEKEYLRDADAEWKDRVDPTFHHPKWRITVRVWERFRIE